MENEKKKTKKKDTTAATAIYGFSGLKAYIYICRFGT